MDEIAPGEKEGIEPQAAVPARLASLAAAVGAAAGGRAARGPAPVERWTPPYCGAIDLRIAADGTWFHNGTPITRRPLVELFATILRRDPDRFVLVTPAECLGIEVEDAPFVAVAMAVGAGDPTGEPARLTFVTNCGDVVEADDDHPLRFETEPDGGLRPYVLVRGGLWARLTRSLSIDLLGRVEEEGGALVLRSGPSRYAVPGQPADVSA